MKGHDKAICEQCPGDKAQCSAYDEDNYDDPCEDPEDCFCWNNCSANEPCETCFKANHKKEEKKQ